MNHNGGRKLQEHRSVLAHARAVQAQLAAILDSFLASGTPLDPYLLADLDRFIHAEAFPAAREYERFLHSVDHAEASPRNKG